MLNHSLFLISWITSGQHHLSLSHQPLDRPVAQPQIPSLIQFIHPGLGTYSIADMTVGSSSDVAIIVPNVLEEREEPFREMNGKSDFSSLICVSEWEQHVRCISRKNIKVEAMIDNARVMLAMLGSCRELAISAGATNAWEKESRDKA